MAEATADDWLNDTAEALAAARAVGEEVIVISTSTGGTLAALAATQPELIEGVKGIVFVSPNFGLNTPLEPLLTWPAARYLLPALAGDRYSFEPENEGQATFWTTEYPSVAILPMAALVKTVAAQLFTSSERRVLVQLV